MTVGPGQVLGVSGPSASGKTTLVGILAGTIDPDAGSVQLSDVTLTDDDVLVETDHRNLMVVQQDAVLDRNHNVAANIAYGLPKDKRRRHVGARRVAMMMDLFELATPLADSRPQELSAGERQRVSMAVSKVKIDRSFIQGIDTSIEASELVANICRMGSMLGKSLVCEGIETQAQLDVLRTLTDIHLYGQGYLFSRPEQAEKVYQTLLEMEEEWLERRQPDKAYLI